jgi:hypothetical protein
MCFSLHCQFSDTGETLEVLNTSTNIRKNLKIVSRYAYPDQEQLFDKKIPEMKNLVALPL